MLELIEIYPQTTTLVGHSLSGFMVDQYQRDNPEINIRTYGAPILSSPWNKSKDRKSKYFDPVSIFDMGSQKSLPTSFNPHSYEGF